MHVPALQGKQWKAFLVCLWVALIGCFQVRSGMSVAILHELQSSGNYMLCLCGFLLQGGLYIKPVTDAGRTLAVGIVSTAAVRQGIAFQEMRCLRGTYVGLIESAFCKY